MLRVEPAALSMYAKHRGMFRKQGIDATLMPLADPSQLVASLLSGDVQFVGVSAGTAASLKSRDAPVKVVAAGQPTTPRRLTPWRTLALQQGAKHIAYPWNAVCAQTCVLAFWIAPANVDLNLAARLRNAIQNAAVWANQRKNDEVSGKILAKYVPMDAAVLKRITRTTYATRLRPSLAQPWLDVFAEYGVIPASFKPGGLVK
jgi:ABC-type nitrate/sulfonate/bicarbonate transport system substrate-binding protein